MIDLFLSILAIAIMSTLVVLTIVFCIAFVDYSLFEGAFQRRLQRWAEKKEQPK